MSHKKTYTKQENKPLDLAALTLSPKAFFGIIMSLGIIIGGLLYGACFRVSTLAADLKFDSNYQLMFEHTVHRVVNGYPIDAMVPYIAKQDRTTAAFLVGIAKKESNWGKRVPVDEEGADCFNYWGYRGAGSRGIEMGHGCFGSPEEAIGIVGGRLDTLAREYQFDTPEELIVWKCGWSCAGHSQQSVKKWISDVGFYFNKIKS